LFNKDSQAAKEAAQQQEQIQIPATNKPLNSAQIMAIIKNYLDAELKNATNATPSAQLSAKKASETIKPQSQPSILATSNIMQNQIRNLTQSTPLLQQTASTKSVAAQVGSSKEAKSDLIGPYYDKTTNQIYFKNSVNNSISDASSNLNRYFVNNDAPMASVSASVSAPVASAASTTVNTVTNNKAPSAYSVSGSINATLKKYTLEDYFYKPLENKPVEKPTKSIVQAQNVVTAPVAKTNKPSLR
jgi:hypothetical protein